MEVPGKLTRAALKIAVDILNYLQFISIRKNVL